MTLKKKKKRRDETAKEHSRQGVNTGAVQSMLEELWAVQQPGSRAGVMVEGTGEMRLANSGAGLQGPKLPGISSTDKMVSSGV